MSWHVGWAKAGSLVARSRMAGRPPGSRGAERRWADGRGAQAASRAQAEHPTPWTTFHHGQLSSVHLRPDFSRLERGQEPDRMHLGLDTAPSKPSPRCTRTPGSTGQALDSWGWGTLSHGLELPSLLGAKLCWPAWRPRAPRPLLRGVPVCKLPGQGASLAHHCGTALARGAESNACPQLARGLRSTRPA